MNEVTNDSAAAILQMVPAVYRKYLLTKTRNQTTLNGKQIRNNSLSDSQNIVSNSPGVDEMLRNIAHYNDLQSVLNEDIFGPLQNDSVIIVVQVSSLNFRSPIFSSNHINSLLHLMNRSINASRIYGI